MNQTEIKYIGFYDIQEQEYKRVSSPAALNKMDYICDALIRAGYSVHIISPSWFDDSASEARYRSKVTIPLGKNKKLTLCPSKGTYFKWARNLKIILSLTWLFFWLLLNVKRREKILMYHTPWLSIPMRYAKYFKRFELILEVEEIYGDVSSIHPLFNKLENQLISSAEKYLLSTELLAKRIQSNKPYAVIYGIYKTYDKITVPPDDNKIHLLYAGIIDSSKAGAYNAIESTRYLSSHYVLHIIGFGETSKFMKKLEELNKENECKIIYDGVKSGDDYVKYLQSCHIGLNTQKMNGQYLETSFPSKILSYLSMELHVVSCYVECVAQSKISSLVAFYNNDAPEEIANAIKAVNVTQKQKSKVLLEELDIQFINEIKKIFRHE